MSYLDAQPLTGSSDTSALYVSDPSGQTQANISVQIRQILERMTNSMIETLVNYLVDSLKLSSKQELEKIDKVFEALKKKAEAEDSGFMKKLFTKIGLAVAIVCVMLVPINPILAGIVVGILVAQLAGEIQSDVSGKSFFNDAMVGLCGGDQEAAKWLTLGLDIGLALVTGGAGFFAKSGTSLAARLGAGFSKQAGTAAKGGGTVATSENVSQTAAVSKTFADRFKTLLGDNPDKTILNGVIAVQITADSVAAGFTIKEGVLKISLAKIEEIVAVLTALIEALGQIRKKQSQELTGLESTAADLSSARTSENKTYYTNAL